VSFPVEITTHHIVVPDQIKDMAREQAEHLERFFQRIVRCEVVFESQNSSDGPYQVRIDLQVPGQTLVVNQKESHDLGRGTKKAFSAARRQLEDYARRQRGEVKNHAGA